MSESIRLFVNVCIVKDDEVLLIDCQHDSFKGCISHVETDIFKL